MYPTFPCAKCSKTILSCFTPREKESRRYIFVPTSVQKAAGSKNDSSLLLALSVGRFNSPFFVSASNLLALALFCESRLFDQSCLVAKLVAASLSVFKLTDDMVEHIESPQIKL